MARDAETTRRKILTVATDEFARHGFAGGRVDRIALAAGCNKSLIYRYFGSKDGLFDAVVDTALAANVAENPIDGDDLPGYAVRMSDLLIRTPAFERLASWDRLERGGRAQAAAAIVANQTHKRDVLAAAQAAGTITDRLPPGPLLQLVVAVALIPYLDPAGQPLPPSERHALIREAVTRLVHP